MGLFFNGDGNEGRMCYTVWNTVYRLILRSLWLAYYLRPLKYIYLNHLLLKLLTQVRPTDVIITLQESLVRSGGIEWHPIWRKRRVPHRKIIRYIFPIQAIAIFLQNIGLLGILLFVRYIPRLGTFIIALRVFWFREKV